jgi:hypothetical protein
MKRTPIHQVLDLEDCDDDNNNIVIRTSDPHPGPRPGPAPRSSAYRTAGASRIMAPLSRGVKGLNQHHKSESLFQERARMQNSYTNNFGMPKITVIDDDDFRAPVAKSNQSYSQHQEALASIPEATGILDCQMIAKHVANCQLCSKYYEGDRNILILIIVVLLGLVAYLLKNKSDSN